MWVEGRPISDEELVTFMTGFFVAGHETTTSALGTLLLHTLPSPELRDRMLADDKVMEAAIEMLNTRGRPIEGLYAAGNVSAGFSGMAYPGGGTAGPALVFGHIAGRSAAADHDKF